MGDSRPATGAQPLSNDDFRRLLATPRAGAGGDDSGRRRRAKPQRPKPKAAIEPEEDTSAYRDRAAERRKGLPGIDDDALADDLARVSHGDEPEGVAYVNGAYMGTDVAPPALVRGLDFALLRKTRAELGGGPAGAGVGHEARLPTPAVAQASTRPRHATPATELPRAPVSATTALGRAIRELVLNPGSSAIPRARAADLFRPRRMAFVYRLDEAETAEIPTTLYRPDDELPKIRAVVDGKTDAALLERVAKIMSYMTAAGHGKRRAKKKAPDATATGLALLGSVKAGDATPPPRATQSATGTRDGAVAAHAAGSVPDVPAGQEAEEEDDIFADAGTDYVVELRRESGEAGPRAPTQRDYFGGGETRLQGPAPRPADVEEEEDTYPDTDAAYVDTTAPAPAPAPPRSAAAVEREEPRVVQRSLLDAEGDAYEELYPAHFDTGTLAPDSDEEGMTTRAVDDAARSELRTREEWESYEAAGSARRGGMGRRGAGRKPRARETERAAAREEGRVAAELSKIQSLFEEKGYGSREAFEAAPDVAPSAAERKKRRI